MILFSPKFRYMHIIFNIFLNENDHKRRFNGAKATKRVTKHSQPSRFLKYKNMYSDIKDPTSIVYFCITTNIIFFTKTFCILIK